MAASVYESNGAVLKKYLDLPMPANTVIATYVWIGGSGELRNKARTYDFIPKDVSELKEWAFDGSSTGQAPGHDSDVYLKPVAIYDDPFLLKPNVIVMCETWNRDGTPNVMNRRYEAEKVMSAYADQTPWFGIEQEYTLFGIEGEPLGWPKNGYPGPQGPYYCSVGAKKAVGRDVVEAHYKACLYSGVQIAGTNAEVMPAQWEFQVGPCVGIKAGDDLWIARYLLERVAEDFGVIVSFYPKPIKGDWNGAGCHTNYSTEAMRVPGGMTAILDAIGCLEKRHKEHISNYGEHNEERLTGAHETANMNTFLYGVGHRGASIRIPHHVAKAGYGYLEDRRPASNMDPYLVTGMIVDTTCSPKHAVKAE